MNLQAVKIDDIPIGAPLPWPLFDRNGYTVLSLGEIVKERAALEKLMKNGLLRDIDALAHLAGAPGRRALADQAASDVFPPDGIKPQIGERVQLRLLRRDVQAFHTARLIGYIRDISILIAAPMVDGQRIDLIEGELVEVRLFTGGNIYRFESAVQRLCISPVHYLHLDFPAHVRVQRLRRSPWAKVALAVLVSNAQGDEQRGSIVNLSPDGAHVELPAALGKEGELLRLAFTASVDAQSSKLQLEAVIRHAHPAKPGSGMLEYGIEFFGLPPQDALWLRCIVYQRIASGYLA